jgi:signal peptidase I
VSPDTAAAAAPGSSPPGAGRLHAFLLILYGVTALLVVNRFGVSFTVMASDSMMPVLRGNPDGQDVVLLDRFTHRARAPRRGEIVHFVGDDGDWVLKRVVALPGETVEIRDGRLLVDGSPLIRPAEVAAVRYENRGHLRPGQKVRVKPDYFLVLGDDSSDSYDSRFWGALARSRIAGTAWAVIWPPARIKSLLPAPGPAHGS